MKAEVVEHSLGSRDVWFPVPRTQRLEKMGLCEATAMRRKWKSHWFRPDAFLALPAFDTSIPSQESHQQGRLQTLNL